MKHKGQMFMYPHWKAEADTRVNSTQCDKHLMSACSIEAQLLEATGRNSESSASPVDAERPAKMLSAACSERRGVLVERCKVLRLCGVAPESFRQEKRS